MRDVSLTNRTLSLESNQTSSSSISLNPYSNTSRSIILETDFGYLIMVITIKYKAHLKQQFSNWGTTVLWRFRKGVRGTTRGCNCLQIVESHKQTLKSFVWQGYMPHKHSNLLFARSVDICILWKYLYCYVLLSFKKTLP